MNKDQNNSDFAIKWLYITSKTCSDFKSKQKTRIPKKSFDVKLAALLYL